MSTAEAAILLDLTERRVRQLIQEGVIPAEREGKCWRITADDEQIVTITAQHRLSPRERAADAYCQAVLRDWMENPPPIDSGWLDEMVDKLVETRCDNQSATETRTDAAPAVLPTAATVLDASPGDTGPDADSADDNPHRRRLQWLAKVGRLIHCGSCGRRYFPAALKRGRCSRCSSPVCAG
jgi:excisionase family DNA binding protein